MIDDYWQTVQTMFRQHGYAGWFWSALVADAIDINLVHISYKKSYSIVVWIF
jgi:hypothetical protein